MTTPSTRHSRGFRGKRPIPTAEQDLVLPEKQAWQALAALVVGFFMILLDQTIVAVAAPAMMVDLDADFTGVVWVSSVYLLCVLVPLLFTGRLGDRYGQRNIYRVGITIFTVSSAACGLAPTIEWLIFARAVQGVGAAILMPQTMSVINRVFARDRRGTAYGVWGSVGGLAGVIAPLLGGFLVSAAGWPAIFWINIPFGILSFVLVTLWVPEMPRHARRIDTLSVVVSLVGMSSLVYGILEGPRRGGDWLSIAAIAFGIILMSVFLWLQSTAEKRETEALVPLAIFKVRNFSIAAFSISTMGFTVASMMLPTMFYLQEGLGMPARTAGLMTMPMMFVSIVFSPVVGKLCDRIHPRILSMTGFGTMGLSLGALGIVMLRDWGLTAFLISMFAMGVGSTLIWAPNSATAMRTIPPKFMGAASGVYNTTRQTGSVIGSAAVGALMQAGITRPGTSVEDAMGVALLLPAAALLLGFASVAAFRSDLDKHQSKEAEIAKKSEAGADQPAKRDAQTD